MILVIIVTYIKETAGWKVDAENAKTEQSLFRKLSSKL